MKLYVKMIFFIVSFLFIYSCNPGNEDLSFSENVENHKDYSIVKLNLKGLEKTSKISKAETKDIYIYLPDGQIVFLEKEEIQKRKTGYSWFGKVKGIKDSSVLITVENGVATGSIKINDNYYRIMPFSINDSLYKIENLSGKKAIPFHDDAIAIPFRKKIDKVKNQQIKKQVALEDGSRIDVLFLYTQAFEDKYGGRNGAISEIRRLVDITNSAFSNSGIITRINPVGFVKFTDPSVDESVSLYDAIRYMPSNEEIDNLRKTYKADLVSLFREYRGRYSCGRGYIVQDLPLDIEQRVQDYVSFYKKYGVSIVENGSYGDSYCRDTSLAHELGHNLGCAHDRDHSNNIGAFPYSYGYDIPDVFATIMSYNRPEINYFSTPNIIYKGHPIGKQEGDPEAADNVKTINKTAILIANYINKNENIQTPPNIYVNLLNVNFGSVTIGDTSLKTVIVKNIGTQNLEINSVSISSNSDFFVNDYCAGKSLSTNASCSIEVGFSPTDTGTKSGALIIKSNASNKPTLNIPVTGKGISTDVPKIDISPYSVNFGTVSVGKSQTREIYIRNTGEEILNINSLNITGSSDFSVKDNCTGKNIFSGDVCNIEVTFSPKSDGTKTATITINSNAENYPFVEIPVRGTGKKTDAPIIEVNPTEIDFGTIFRKESLTKTITVKNSSKVRNLDIYVNTTASQDFKISHNCPDTLYPNSFCSITVTFQPAKIGEKEYRFHIETNDPNKRRVYIYLHGNVIPSPAYIKVKPSKIDFGELNVGDAVKKYVYIKNTGDETLRIKSTASTNNEFKILKKCEYIKAEEICELVIEFKPEKVGEKKGLLIIKSNAENEKRVGVLLTGKALEKVEPHIVILKKTLDFGSVITGKTATERFTIKNTGNSELHLNNSVTGKSFSIVSNCKIIKPDSSCDLILSFTPSNIGVIEGRLNITSDDPKNEKISVFLKGKGIPKPVPVISVFPKILEFKELIVNSSAQKSITVENKGSAKLLIRKISIDNESFSVENNCKKLNPKEKCIINIKFKPKKVGSIRGVLTIISNDNIQPVVKINLSGTGKEKPLPKLDTSINSLNFGEVPVGNTKKLYFSIKNEGNANLVISSIDLLRSIKDFAVSYNCSILKPKEKCSIAVSFNPTKTGEIKDTVIIKSNVGDAYIKLYGKGLGKKEPKVVLSPDSIEFGNVRVGETEEKSLNIKNNGTENLEIYSISLEGSKNFSLKEITKESVCKILKPKEKCKIIVTYNPKEESQDTAYLVIKTNDPELPVLRVLLSGLGVKQPKPNIYVSQKTLNFGAVEIGKKSKVKEITVKNRGNDTLVIKSILSTKNDFIVKSECNTLSPNKSCKIKVIFAPTKTGKITNILKIISNDPEQYEINIILTGIGKKPSVPDILVFKKYIDFGTVFIGKSRELTVHITNNGTAPLNIEKIILTGDNDFYMKNNCLNSLEPKEKCTVLVRFNPYSQGTKTGLLKIISDDSDENISVVKILGNGKKFETKEFDIDNDGDISVQDILSLTKVILKGEKEQKVDINADGEIDIADIILLIKALKLKGE